MKCSCIDVGSNTVKISVFEKCGQQWKNVGYMGEQTKLISYVIINKDEKILSDDGKKALYEVLERLIDYSSSQGVEYIFAFATASLRGVSNASEIIEDVYKRFGVSLEILSAEEEALCSLKGLLLDEKCEGINNGVMIDLGGGSTEIVYFENGKEPEIVSLDFGCLSLTDRFVKSFPPPNESLDLIRRHVRDKLLQCSFIKNSCTQVFLIGGTARAAAKMAFELFPRNKEIFKSSDFISIAEKMVCDDEVRKIAKELIPKRLFTITAGCVAYYEILECINPSEIHLSESGVREGYLERILL